MLGNLSKLNNKLFSIITINYNNRMGLESTVESIITQSCNNFEYIIVDGGSEDGSKEYLSELNIADCSIVSERDNGIYDAMNKGIKFSSGEYLIFMNSGDCFANPNVLDLLQKQILKCSERPKFIYGDSFEKEINDVVLLHKRARNHSKKHLGMFTHHQSMIFSNDILVNNNIFYNKKYTLAADWDFVLRFLKNLEENQIMKFDKPIAIFESGGISSNYVLGIKEQLNIRRELLGWNRLKCLSIAIYQYLANNIRRITPFVYKLYVKFGNK